MFFRLHVVTGLLLGFLFAGGNALIAQQRAPTPQGSLATPPTLAAVARNLPHYAQQKEQANYSRAIENATAAERDSALPDFIYWIEDARPQVRRFSLLSLDVLYLPSEKRQGPGYLGSLPVEDVPAVAAHLRDPDLSVRNATFSALQPTVSSGVGMDELIKLVMPMLREPDVMMQYPDPFFVESDQRMLAGMTPEQQTAFKAQPRKVIKLPAEGVGLLALITSGRHPSTAVDDALLAFLDRADQTKSTLRDCLHTIALSFASERVNDEALRLVFEHKAMTIFLLQFVSTMRLTPAQLTVQKGRLLALSNDESAHPALRRSARDVAACWNGERTGQCQPSDQDAAEQLDTR